MNLRAGAAAERRRFDAQQWNSPEVRANYAQLRRATRDDPRLSTLDDQDFMVYLIGAGLLSGESTSFCLWPLEQCGGSQPAPQTPVTDRGPTTDDAPRREAPAEEPQR